MAGRTTGDIELYASNWPSSAKKATLYSWDKENNQQSFHHRSRVRRKLTDYAFDNIK